MARTHRGRPRRAAALRALRPRARRHRAAAAAHPRGAHRRSAASTAGHCATAPPTRSLAAVDAGPRARAASALRLPESDRIDRALAPAVTVLGAWLAQRASRARPRPGRARDPRRPHAAVARRAEPARDGLARRPRRRAAPAAARGRGGARAARRRPPDRAPRRPRHGDRRAASRSATAWHGSRSACSCTRRPRPSTSSAPRGRRPTRSASTASGSGTTSIPLYGDPDAAHFEAYTLLAAMAADTEHARARRARHVQLVPQPEPARRHGAHDRPPQRRALHARHRLGLVRARLRRVRLRVRHRARPAARPRARRSRSSWSASAGSTPPPRGPLPILIGGRGEKVTLRLVAEHADAWNTFGPPDELRARRTACSTSGARSSAATRARSSAPSAIQATEVDDWQAYLDAGAEHLIVMTGPPFDLDPVRKLLDSARDSYRASAQVRRRACRRGPCRSAAARASPSRA